MINSRQKGARGEREWRDELRAQGYEAHRGQQFCGGGDSPDVTCKSLPQYHFEVKRTERLNIYDAYEQAVRDSLGTQKTPIVAHKRNNQPWLVIMTADHYFELIRETNPPPSPEYLKFQEHLRQTILSSVGVTEKENDE